MTIILRLLLATFTVAVVGCSRASQQSSTSDSAVTVALGGPTGDIKGLYWPTGNSVESLTIEKPRTITLRLPSGRTWTCRSKITFLSQAEEAVSRVEVAPLDEVSDFASSASALQRVFDELGVAAESPARIRVNTWQAEPPAWGPYAIQSLKLEVEQGVEMIAEIKPAHAQDRWILLCSFDAHRPSEPEAGGSPTP